MSELTLMADFAFDSTNKTNCLCISPIIRL